MIQSPPVVPDLLARWRRGDEEAGHRLFGLVYDELRRIAGHYLRGEAPGHTLQPTALVHEACVRLAGGAVPEINDRAHLVAIAARLMRQVLVNHAARRNAAKRGGQRRREPLDVAVDLYEQPALDLVALDDALRTLARRDPRLAEVVELRFFGGLTTAEIATVLDTSPRTVERDWALARAWLRTELVES